MALSNSKRTYASYSESFGASSVLSDPVPTPKRRRANNQPSLWNQILSLPHTTTQSLLYQICNANPALSSFVQSAHNARLAEEAARPPVNFDQYSRDCWYTMNKKYKRLSCRKQFEMMGDVCQVLDESRDAIVGAAGPDVRWETRRNALEVLRKICKSIALCDEPQIRHELTKDGYMLGQFADSMQELARGMNEEERERYKAEGLYEKLVDLSNDCGPDDMEGLPAVYRIFDQVEDEEEDYDNTEDEDEDCDTDAIAGAYDPCDDQSEDEMYHDDVNQVNVATAADPEAEVQKCQSQTAHIDVYARAHGQRIGLGERAQQVNTLPSQPPRTKVFSIGELS
ncbi:hypothetical protein BUE80_DR002268 [Diplocarpon rosae]|nr:hypothetical protein BUE80_DR002268 [Diplocarpon rosae]